MGRAEQSSVGISGEIAERLADARKAFADPAGGFADGAGAVR